MDDDIVEVQNDKTDKYLNDARRKFNHVTSGWTIHEIVAVTTYLQPRLRINLLFRLGYLQGFNSLSQFAKVYNIYIGTVRDDSLLAFRKFIELCEEYHSNVGRPLINMVRSSHFADTTTFYQILDDALKVRYLRENGRTLKISSPRLYLLDYGSLLALQSEFDRQLYALATKLKGDKLTLEYSIEEIVDILLSEASRGYVEGIGHAHSTIMVTVSKAEVFKRLFEWKAEIEQKLRNQLYGTES